MNYGSYTCTSVLHTKQLVNYRRHSFSTLKLHPSFDWTSFDYVLKHTSRLLSGTIIKRGMHLIHVSRFGSISKWSLHWLYYDLNANISHKQPHLTYIRTYQVFMSLAHTAGMVSSCSSIADVRNHSMTKTQFSSSSFFLSCQKHYYTVTQSQEKLQERAYSRTKHCA